MNKSTALLTIAIWCAFFLLSCNKDDEVTKLEDRVDDLEKFLSDSSAYNKYRDSLEFIIAMEEIQYQRYLDSLKRADSIALNGGLSLPFSYNILVYDGSNTAVNGGSAGGSRTTAFSSEVSITISQFGESRTITTTNGLASFDNVGRGIINGSISAEGYTTLEWSTETLIKPSGGLIDNEDYMDYVLNSSLGHSFALFATAGENVCNLAGRATVETDLTNPEPELVPEGTAFLAFIDVDNTSFQERFVTNQNKELFTDNILTFGYSPVLKSAIDAAGDYTFVLPASPYGLPIKLTYSDFVADQVIFVEDNGDVTEKTASTVFGPGHTPTVVPVISLAPNVVFQAGGGAAATAQVSGTGSVTAINLINGGQNFQGTPSMIIDPPSTPGGTRAAATATVSNGVVTGITLTDGGSGYTATPTITITEGSGATASVTSLEPIDYDNGNDVGGGVGAVQIVSSGIYWDGTAPVAPFVLFNGVLEGSAANVPDVTVAMNAQGNIASITVNDNGYGYATAPAASFSAGQLGLAEVSAVDGTGAITGVTITNPGQYYAAITSIDVISTGGADAQFTVDIDAANNYSLTNLQITNGGGGYAAGDQITFGTALVSAASATAIWEGASVESYQITSAYGGTANTLYTTTPLIVFSEPDYNGPGARTAMGTAVITNGRLTGITITGHGRGYYTVPTITVLSGSGASAQAVFDEMKISGFSITDQGAGYLAAPDVLIIDLSGSGTGATATASLTDGRVTSLNLNNAGSGYINSGDIRVFFLDPGTTYDPVNHTMIPNVAEATVEVTDGVITAINVTSAGNNYKAAPVVLIESSKGSGFAGTVNVAGGRVSGVVVDNGGVGYVNGNNPGTQAFAGSTDFTSTSGITKIVDVHYGTGKRR